MINRLQAFIEVCNQFPVITEIVGERIYPNRVPGGKELLPAIVFTIRTGTQDKALPIYKPSYQIKCYATSAQQAESLYKTIYESFHGAELIPVTGGKVL